jgi:CDP-L-myo-inositol myo-inositolphosphotransferase
VSVACDEAARPVVQVAAARAAAPVVFGEAPAGAVVVSGDRVFDVAGARRLLGAGEGGVVMPAGTPEERRAAQRALLRSLAKPSDGPVSRLLNRPLSLSVTRLLLDTRVTPNQMTIVANLIGAFGVALVFRGQVVLGAALLQAQSILDGTDGELARLKFRSSRLGEWLDNVLDDQINVAYAVALGFAAGSPWRGLAIGAAGAITLYNLVLYHQLATVHHSGNPFLFRWWFQKDGADLTATFARPTPGMRVAAGFRALVRRDVFLLAFLGLTLLDLVPVCVVWYALIAAGHLVMCLLHLAQGGMPRPKG